MKRFGEKALREALKNGAIVRFWDWYTLSAGYRVIINDEVEGYITYDLFTKILHDGTIEKCYTAFAYTDYKATETEEEPETEPVTDEMQDIKIPGYVGKWSAFEKCVVNNREFYIMEHNTYGDETQYLVIECTTLKGAIFFLNIFETYDDIITCLTDEEII